MMMMMEEWERWCVKGVSQGLRKGEMLAKGADKVLAAALSAVTCAMTTEETRELSATLR